MRTTSTVRWLATAALVCACAEEPDIDSVDHGLISMNSLALANVVANQADVKSALSSRLASTAVTRRMGATASGDQVMTYLVRGALPNATGVTIPGAITQPYKGFVGLASPWLVAALSDPNARWLVAATVAYMNAFGASVHISLRGPHPALAVSPQEFATYRYQEGAFYGNRELQMFACPGDDTCAECGNTAVPAMEQRVMTSGNVPVPLPLPAGMTFKVEGRCRDVCAGYSNGYWFDCKGGPDVYRETVTVYLLGNVPYACAKAKP